MYKPKTKGTHCNSISPCKIKSIILTCLFASISGLMAQNPAPIVGSWNTGTIPTVTLNNAGVGTLTPQAKLEVKFQPCVLNQTGLLVTSMRCTFNGPAPDPGNGGVVIIGGGGAPVTNYFPNIAWAFPSSTLTMPLITNVDKPLLWLRDEKSDPNFNLTGYNSRLIVLPNGSTGINTAQPRAMLDVLMKNSTADAKPTAVFSSIKQVGSISLTNPETNQLTSVSGYTTRSLLFFNNLPEDNYNRIVQSGDQAIIFTDGAGTQNTESTGGNVSGALVIAPFDNNVSSPSSVVGGIRIDKDGNVDLNGITKCRKLVVAPKWWADYVLNKNYALLPLDSLSNFIEKNNHLPDVPTEKELLDSGINVSDMQAIQQSKIEELTLYIIQQNEMLKKVQAELLLQKEKITAIENKPIIKNK